MAVNLTSMMVSDEAYQNHDVFTELERYESFYEKLAFSCFPWATMGTKAAANIDSYVFSSIQGTMCSIKLVLREGMMNDAFALLRKYHDSIVMNIYTGLYLDNNFSIQNLIVEQISDWLSGKAQMPEFRTMSRYIRESEKLAKLWPLLNQGDIYKRVRDLCNDHTHYNFYRNVLLNDKEIHIQSRGKQLDNFYHSLNHLFILHFSCLFTVREYYMMSSDYLDCLECNMTPDPDSLRWVVPFVQEIFTEVIKERRADIADLMLEETEMELE